MKMSPNGQDYQNTPNLGIQETIMNFQFKLKYNPPNLIS